MADLPVDELQVVPLERDGEGEKLEPEERPARRLVTLDAPVSGSIDGATGQQMAATVSIEATAGEFAFGMRKMCLLCVHFDQRAWIALKRSWELGGIDKQMALNEIRAALLETQNAQIQDMQRDASGDTDVENALTAHHGICHALSEQAKDVIIVHQACVCPEGFDGFKARNPEADKFGSAAFDSILRTAQGRGE